MDNKELKLSQASEFAFDQQELTSKGDWINAFKETATKHIDNIIREKCNDKELHFKDGSYLILEGHNWILKE